MMPCSSEYEYCKSQSTQGVWKTTFLQLVLVTALHNIIYLVNLNYSNLLLHGTKVDVLSWELSLWSLFLALMVL